LEGFTIRIGGEYVNEEGWDLNKLEDGATELNVSLGQIYISVLEGIREQFPDNKDLADQKIKQDSFGQAIDQILLQRIIAGLAQYAASGEHELTIGANSSETPSTTGIVVTTTQNCVDQSLEFAQVALGYHE
ncbi:hypothetical protein KA531_00290, partial [Candidatus Saccharibacteria bacterium]|nr:hypothetical protein [Candidatus Saccharibacteria bacterium]